MDWIGQFQNFTESRTSPNTTTRIYPNNILQTFDENQNYSSVNVHTCYIFTEYKAFKKLLKLGINCHSKETILIAWSQPVLVKPDKSVLKYCSYYITQLPWTQRESLPFLYWDTLCKVCFLHFLLAQNVRLVFGTFTYNLQQKEHHVSSEKKSCWFTLNRKIPIEMVNR